MAKSTKASIENDIQNIISELQKNSNNSVNIIADKLGFSRQKVWRIIKDLEKNNTIWGYTAIIDDNKIGKKRFIILLKKASIPVKEEKINLVVNKEIRKIATKTEIKLESSFFVNGPYDGVLCVTAENVNRVKIFLEKLYQKLDGIYVSKAIVMEVLFPIERDGFDNPNIQELKEFF